MVPGVTKGTSYRILLRISNYYGGKFMSLRDFFSRNSKPVEVTTSQATTNEVACDTTELKELITKWTQSEGWKFENFSDFIELVGVKTPVKLSELNKDTNTFKCLTALNTEVLISIRFRSWLDSCPEIHVTEGDETRRYITNCNIEKGKSIPSVTLQGRVIKKTGKELSSFYCEYFCHRILKIDDTHTLKVETDEPGKYDGKSEIFVLRNCADIENYLLGLDNSLVVSQVYDTMMQLLGFSGEDIFNSAKILISYNETVDKEERVLGKILLTKGNMQEYAILENGETFHVFRDGSWRYSSGGIRIFYLEEKKHHVFSITGAEENITNANPSEIMSRVKKKISELWKFVK